MLRFSFPGEYSPIIPIIPENLARFETLEKKTAYFLDSVLPCLVRTAPPPAVGLMLKRITETGGTIRIDELAGGLSCSSRHISRLFLAALGCSPKSFCRYARFQTVLAAMERAPGRNSAAFLQKTGYSDRAHFQREFREFTGITPGSTHDS